MNRQLQVIPLSIDLAADENHIVTVKGFDRLFEVVPPLTDDVAGPVRKRHEDELTARFLLAELLRFDEQRRADRLIRREITDESFHEVMR
jgi:hypothetical protein